MRRFVGQRSARGLRRVNNLVCLFTCALVAWLGPRGASAQSTPVPEPLRLFADVDLGVAHSSDFKGYAPNASLMTGLAYGPGVLSLVLDETSDFFATTDYLGVALGPMLEPAKDYRITLLVGAGAQAFEGNLACKVCQNWYAAYQGRLGLSRTLWVRPTGAQLSLSLWGTAIYTARRSVPSEQSNAEAGGVFPTPAVPQPPEPLPERGGLRVSGSLGVTGVIPF